MMIDAGKPQVFEGPRAERLEQLSLGVFRIHRSAGDRAEQVLQLRGIHRETAWFC
jgi:hypothetical protein